MNDRDPFDEDVELAGTIRRAGPRRPVPAAATERVRVAARDAWQRKVAARRRRQRVGLIVAAAAVVLALVTAQWALRGDGMPASVGEAVAQVEWVGGSGPVVPGEIVKIGRTMTLGDEVLVALRSNTGHSVRLAPGTIARFETPTILALEAGAVYIDSGTDTAGGSTLDVRTSLGLVSELGTRFEVRTREAGLRVRVRDGRVALTSEGGRHEAAAGTEISIDSGNAVVTREVAAYGDEWDWVLRAAPAPEIDERPLRELLGWVARETGWTIGYADDTLAARAPEILLRGSIKGLSPEQALDATLPACGLTHTVQSGRLLIAASAPAGA